MRSGPRTYSTRGNDQQFRTVLGDRRVVPTDDDLPEPESQLWQVRRADNGGYTIRQDTTDLYLGYEGELDTFEPVRLLPDRREWNITNGPEEGVEYVHRGGSGSQTSSSRS